jgi:outer membrane cobalamin receptor
LFLRTLQRSHLALLFFFAGIAVAQQLPDEKVVVTANAYPVPFENLSRTVAVFTSQDISEMPVHSIADILEQTAFVDVRSRAPFGMQSDMSVRGSAFSQVLVLVDGVRINDSQTGHHNSDFPVQLQDVDRVEILRGSGSSLYGADASGGIVSIVTKHNPEPPRASLSVGQYGLVSGAFAMDLKKGKLEQSISASANRSSGFEYDRDFQSIALSSHTGIGSRTTLYFSHVNKEFGANGFYGPSPSKEWTNQTLISLEHSFERSSGKQAAVKGYYRTHGDRFLYDIRKPGLFENTHRTHAAGAQITDQFKLAEAGLLTLGGELGGAWIASSNLGHHECGMTSAFGELQWTLGKSAVVYPGVRFDYYSNFGAAVSPSLSGSWWLLPRLRLRSSVGHAFRIPTFTELYYRDPNNQGNPLLKPESAWSADLGADYIPARNWLASMTVFSRRERDVIDWIRSSPAEKWHTANIHKIHTDGVELGLERSFGARAHLAVQYSRIFMDAGHVDYMSKYVLDYARDSFSGSTSFPLPLALACKQTITYRRRSDGRSYWVWDGSLGRHFSKFFASVDFTNLLDTEYQEVRGVDMPGRWFMLSLRTR